MKSNSNLSGLATFLAPLFTLAFIVFCMVLAISTPYYLQRAATASALRREAEPVPLETRTQRFCPGEPVESLAVTLLEQGWDYVGPLYAEGGCSIVLFTRPVGDQ